MQLEAEPEFLEELSAEHPYLYVPFAERERVRALGAKWDAKICLWYVTPSMNHGIFARWRPIWPLEDDPVVKVLGIPSSCWKCRAQTLAVAACQYDDQLTFAHKGVLQVLASQLTADDLSEIGAGPLRPRYSNVTRLSNWSNGCVDCDAVIGGLPLSENFRAMVSQGQADLPVIALARVPVDMLRGLRDFG
jgi:hypothetical protein